MVSELLITYELLGSIINTMDIFYVQLSKPSPKKTTTKNTNEL